MGRRASPVRTCVGCRRRALISELLRVVVMGSGADHLALRPDPERRLPGRGAHVHPDPACLVLAQRRGAWARALRVTGVLDTGALVEHLARAVPRAEQPTVTVSAAPETAR